MRRWCAQRNGGQASQALGRSRGGFSAKIHIAIDAPGHPLRFILTAGHCHASPQAPALIEGFSAQGLSADKGYASDPFLGAVTAEGVQAVIPPRSDCTRQREYDQLLHRERHLIEGFINKLKHYRHVFSRFGKLSQNFLGVLRFVSALMWLR